MLLGDLSWCPWPDVRPLILFDSGLSGRGCDLIVIWKNELFKQQKKAVPREFG
jgi:hypothetical protein